MNPYREKLKKSAGKIKKNRHLLNTSIDDDYLAENISKLKNSPDVFVNFDNLILCVDTEPEFEPELDDSIDYGLNLRKASSDANFVSLSLKKDFPKF